MKILFITLSRIQSITQSGIYTDLLRKFKENNHDLYIVSPNERRYGKATNQTEVNGLKILNPWTPNIQKTNIFEKIISTLLIEYIFLYKIKKNIDVNNLDLIIYTTPPITFTNLILYLQKKSNAKKYLLLKDIFPQNAVDLNFLNKNTFTYKYFRNKEKLLYQISDHIGCMSKANLNYIIKNNSFLDSSKIEINPNTLDIDYKKNSNTDINIYSKYNIPKNKTLFIFGGNLGKPQGVNYLIKNIKFSSSINNAFFIIVGDGTEFLYLKKWIFNNKLNNVMLIKELDKNNYDNLLKVCHVGLISLSPLFTIPNFPSRLLSYLENKMPVICTTDNFTDIGIIAKKNNFGFSCNILNKELFKNYVNKLTSRSLRKNMGRNGFNFLQKEYNVNITYRNIINKLQN